MIQYYKTEAEYAAAAKSPFESQISLVGEDNAVKFDGRNVIVDVRAALTGSIAVLDGASALHFVDVDTYNSASFMSNFTEVGVVAIGVDHPMFRGKIVIVHKTNASKKWSEIYSFKLTGYTLDGTARTGVLSVREAANWATAVDHTVNYNASTVAGFVQQLNAYFKANAPFTTQSWRADADAEGNVTLSFLFSDYRQASNTGKSGFTLAANLLPEIAPSSGMHRRNGQRSGEGAISNLNRALSYFSQDLNNATYNPKTPVTSPVRSYPICKPGYLGTSQYSDGDQCAALRAIYGPGEAGWQKFMESFLPLLPSKVGVMDKATYGDGLTNTYIMAGRTFEKQDGSVIEAHPAAKYCAAVVYNHEALQKGCWHLPDVETLVGILKDIAYPVPVNNRNNDKINRALLAIGGTAISNGSGIWSSSRYGADFAWCSLGYGGCLYGNYLSYTSLALPVALLDVSEANSNN